MKTLKDFLEVYEPKAPDEKKFKDKHVTIKHKDRNEVNGKENGDDVFNASNVKTVARKDNRQGYNVGEDEKVYEEVGLGEAVTVNKKNYSWGKMVTVTDGSSTTYPLHPEHQEKIAKLNDGEKTTFKDETGATVHAHRAGGTVHLKKPGYSNRATAVAHSHFAEEVDVDALLDEALEMLEKTLTPAEKKKREEIAKAIERETPDMPMAQKMAIATAQAKKVAEEVEDLDELSTDTMNNYRRDRSRTAFSGGRKPGESVDDGIKRKSRQINSIALARTKMNRVQNTGSTILNKEEVEDLDESAKVAAHLIKRYGDNVRKSHVVSAANDFGVDASKLAKAVRTKLGKTSLAEEEQIDELSKETKASYMKKAGAEIDKHWDNSQKDARSAYKYYGRKNTMKKIANEEVEELDEISAKKLTDYAAKASDASGHRDMPTDKLDKRYKSMALAQEKIRGRHAKVAAEGYVPTADEPTEADKKTAQKVRDMMAKEKKPVKEEALDELSNDTLRRYRMKAKSIGDNEKGDINYRAKGRDLSGRKTHGGQWGIPKAKVMASEEADQIDELSKATMGGYINKAKDSIDSASYRQGAHRGDIGSPRYNNLEKKLSKRHKGIETAVKKLTKEESENLDELSKATMGRYINKAATKMGSQGVTAGLKIAADEKSSKNFKDMGKREKGISRAVKNLTKEDIINRAVEKYVPEELKFTAEERILKRLEGLAEGHIDMLMDLFESLNDANQAKMIESAETQEGLNQLLDFAINNRGA